MVSILSALWWRSIGNTVVSNKSLSSNSVNVLLFFLLSLTRRGFSDNILINSVLLCPFQYLLLRLVEPIEEILSLQMTHSWERIENILKFKITVLKSSFYNAVFERDQVCRHDCQIWFCRFSLQIPTLGGFMSIMCVHSSKRMF